MCDSAIETPATKAHDVDATPTKALARSLTLVVSSPRNDIAQTPGRTAVRLLNFSRRPQQAKQPYDAPVSTLLRARGVKLSPRPLSPGHETLPLDVRWKKRARSSSKGLVDATGPKKSKCSPPPVALTYPSRVKGKAKMSTAIDAAIRHFQRDQLKTTTYYHAPTCHVVVARTQGTRPYMEDEHVVQKQVFEDSGASVFGIFDGHNGGWAAEFASTRLVELVSAHDGLHAIASRYAPLSMTADVPLDVSEDDVASVYEGLTEVFLALDDEILTQTIARKQRDGATGLVLLVLGPHVFCANVGDTRAVRGTWSKADDSVCTDRVSLDHKPTLEAETARIVAAGGQVIFSGCWRVAHEKVGLRLAVSRSFGDHPLKLQLPSSCAAPLVSCVPSLRHFRIDTESAADFVVLASDGLWDRLDDDEAVETVQTALAQAAAGEGGLKDRLKAAANALIQSALERKSYDNITTLLVVLKAPSVVALTS
ncbi:hypothetical protein SPRG_15734 [Saprolegnia parasitica CBS 223.65]|uniref:PPM-type phosphatase domain-containing protein n=1 Tax=Saprolegnia parasitica (strain CBS 223.65) TaxID=695850 RepID=A0A067BKS3_SAPPC|nr:hypothetical protein SPRG_15734 [Saprolegnia parasitica CBS 223.65]KDO19069.1 hypothetical protein SPRG_15734 [Saprolegnia parasitica CBS 223.65]|eukprot:XP_012210225.1 hypothetical protein SPRG_15734 [Saprolegnia parasitica CBS 223.65]